MAASEKNAVNENLKKVNQTNNKIKNTNRNYEMTATSTFQLYTPKSKFKTIFSENLSPIVTKEDFYELLWLGSTNYQSYSIQKPLNYRTEKSEGFVF